METWYRSDSCKISLGGAGVKTRKKWNNNNNYNDNLWNMKATVIPIVVGVCGAVLKGLEKRLKEL